MNSISHSHSISVVIPLFNGGRWIEATLDHIAAQEVRPAEVIVVDDGSGDDGAERVEARRNDYFCSLQLLSQSNGGVARARNTGIAAASGNLLILLDQDDVWPASALRDHIQAWQGHPETDATWGQQQLFLEPGMSCPSWLRPHFLEHPSKGTFFSGFLARREVFERVGPLDESYQMGSDTDWFARAQEARLNIIHLPEVTLRKRVHGENHSAQVETAHNELTRALHASLRRRRAQAGN